MPNETISIERQLELPNGAIAHVIRPDLLYVNEQKSINGMENDKFICRVMKDEVTPEFLEFCLEDRDFSVDQVYIQHSAEPKKRFRVNGIIFPEDAGHKDKWIYIWKDTAPISIVPFDKIVRHSVEGFDPDGQDLILLEEMLELGLELLHDRRDRGSRAHIIEELSHVMVSSQVLKQVLNITDDEINAEAMKKLRKYGWDELTV